MKTKSTLSLKDQVGGADIVLGQDADPSTINLLTLSAAQSQSLITQIEREHLLEAYDQGNYDTAPPRVAELLLQVFDSRQIAEMQSPKLSVITGLNPGAKYKPRSYAGQKTIPRANDTASLLCAVLIEAIILATKQTLVRVPGVQDANDPSHRISTVAQIAGQEKKLTSGGVGDFGFHGDGDGFNLRIVDSLITCGQINDGFVPTLYANLFNVLNTLDRDSEDWRHVEILENPMFVSQVPGFVGERQSLCDNWARPVIRARRNDLYLHATTRVHPDIDDTALIEQCNTALQWLRDRLAATAIGVSLRPYQFAIISNTMGKHAVWQKTLGKDGLSRRQFMRGYGSKSVGIPGASCIEAPLF